MHFAFYLFDFEHRRLDAIQAHITLDAGFFSLQFQALSIRNIHAHTKKRTTTKANTESEWNCEKKSFGLCYNSN